MLKYIFICAFMLSMNAEKAESESISIDAIAMHSNEGDFNRALLHASSNGKLLLVDFYASWCTPCKWMDKTTFKNEAIARQLNSNYIVYKANIDDPNGFKAKQQFNISVLPTLLIFNTKGELKERIEETITAESLLPILEFHNNPNNTLKITHQINQSPQEDEESSLNEAQELQILYEAYKRKEKVKSNYRLQIGVYDDYREAFKKVNELRSSFLEEIIVLNDYRNGLTLYKVMMGQFQTQNEAESFRKILTEHYDIDAIVH